MSKRTLFILLAFLPFFLDAQTLYHVRAVSVDNQSKQVKELLQISKNDVAGMQAVLQIKDKIGEALLTNAYYLAHFKKLVLDSSKESITLYFKVGQQFKWIDLEKGNCNEVALSKASFYQKKFEGKPFSGDEVKGLFNSIISFYEDHGYPFAAVNLKNIKIDEGKISASLNVNPNKLCKVDSIIIKGNAKINPHYIYDYIGIEPGDIYNESLIKKIGQKLQSLPFVAMNKSYRMVFLKNKSKLYIYLNKRNANQINAIIGFLPDNETGKIRFTGQADLKLQNAFRRGETIEFNWQNLQKQTQNLTAGINYPYLFNLPFGVDYNINLYKKDSSYLDVSNKIGLSYLFRGNQSITFFVNIETSSLLNAENYKDATTLPSFADFKSTSYGISLHLQHLNYQYNPTKGYMVDLTASAGKKSILKNPALDANLYDSLKLNQLQLNFSGLLQYYIHINDLNTILLQDRTGLINSNGILFNNELFKIGGINSLRGFDDQSILASFYSIQTIEYHFLLEQESYLYLFADYCFYNNFSNEAHISDQPFSFGPGIAFSTGAGIFSINYALGEQQGNPILLKNGKVHFGFIARF